MTSLHEEKARLATPRASWAIQVAKESLKFSAAHFLIFADGSAERLHGHNYQVSVELRSGEESHGMVVDFKVIKPLIRRLVDRLDERLLLPGEHPGLTIERMGGEYEFRYGNRRYVAPVEDIVVLPISNTSSENLARWLAERLLDRLRREHPDVRVASLEVGVEETPGQRGLARLEMD